MKICTACWEDGHGAGHGAQWCSCCATGHGTGENMTVKVYDPEIHGHDDVRRNRVREWLESNGVDTRVVSVDGCVWVEGSHIHYLGHVLTPEGAIQFSPGYNGPILDDLTHALKVAWVENEEESNG